MNKMLVSKPVETDFLLERARRGSLCGARPRQVEELLRIMKALKLVNRALVRNTSKNGKIWVERGFLLTCWHKIEKLAQL